MIEAPAAVLVVVSGILLILLYQQYDRRRRVERTTAALEKQLQNAIDSHRKDIDELSELRVELKTP